MPRRLLIRLDCAGEAAWLALGRDGVPLHGERAGLPPAAVADDVIETVLLVPAEDVLVLPLPELPGSARQRAQALPFAIEEQLAAPVEQQHVLLAKQPDAVLVVARQAMDAWLQRLHAAGLRADRMLPDAWLLPYPSLLLQRHRVLLRPAAERAWAFPAAQLAEYAALLDAAGALEGAVDVLRIDSDAEVPFQQRKEQRFPDLLSALAPQLGSAGGADLLQGAYAPRHRHAGAERSWRLAAVLGGAALLAALGFAMTEYYALQQRARQQQAQMEALYRSVVPGAAQVPDPAARLRSLLAARGGPGSDGVLELLRQVAPALAGSGRFTIDALEYRGSALEITLQVPDVATLDSLRDRLDSLPPLRAQILSSTAGSSGFEGRLRVHRAGPA